MSTPIPINQARYSVWRVAAATGGRIVQQSGDGATAVGLVTDTRAIRYGNGFVALRGPRHDGHDYLEQAVQAGAPLIVVERGAAKFPPQVDVVEVDDTLVAWGLLARAHLRFWRRARVGLSPARVVAVTGSAGKTTTKELCAAILRRVGSTLASGGNLNNRVGVPAVALCVQPEHRFVVFEVGMSVPGEIAKIAAICEPDVAVITNIGLAHAEGVGGTRGDVAHEKGSLFEGLGRDGVAIVNVDDEAVRGQMARTRALRSDTFGTGELARYRLTSRVSRGERGARLTIERPGVAPGPADAQETLEFDFPLIGEAAAIDFVAALACAEGAHGTSIEQADVQVALDTLVVPGARVAVTMLRDGTMLLDDSYNANPASMRAALGTLAELARSDSRRAVAVLGEMKELGPRADAEHERLGEAIEQHELALVIGCGGLIDKALDRAAALGITVIKGQDTDAAAKLARRHVRPSDVVLVKASRSVAAEKVVSALCAARGESSPPPSGKHP